MCVRFVVVYISCACLAPHFGDTFFGLAFVRCFPSKYARSSIRIWAVLLRLLPRFRLSDGGINVCVNACRSLELQCDKRLELVVH